MNLTKYVSICILFLLVSCKNQDNIVVPNYIIEQEEFLKNCGVDQVFDYNKVGINDIEDTFDVILDLTNLQTLKSIQQRLTANGVFIPAEPNKENGGESEDPQAGYLMVMHGDFDKLTRIANWVSEGRLKAVIDKEFFFSEYKQAISRLGVKGRRGRIILNW